MLAVPELIRALHPRHLLYDTTQVDNTRFACQHVGPVDENKHHHETTAHRGSLFHEAADGYQQANDTAENTPLLGSATVASERCVASQRAYSEYTAFLTKIDQLEPLPWHAPEAMHAERKAVREQNASTALGFRRYLQHRTDASDFAGSRRSALQHSWRFLREGTVDLLSRKRLAPLTVWQKLAMAVILYTLLFNFVVQARACWLVRHETPDNWYDWTAPLRKGVNPRDAESVAIALLTAFVIKECFFITFYLVWLVVFICGIALAIVVGTVSAIIALVLVLPVFLIVNQMASSDRSKSALGKMARFMRRAKRNPLGLELQRFVIKQANLIAHMALNLSILYRIKEWALAMFLHRSRAVDFSVKLTSVANVMFNVALLLCEGDYVDPLLLIAEASVLILLFREMVEDEMERRAIHDAFKDLSQNRLSKVEFALLLTKLTEDVIHEPACSNFVEHFYTSSDQDETSFRVVATEEWTRADGSYLRSRLVRPDSEDSEASDEEVAEETKRN